MCPVNYSSNLMGKEVKMDIELKLTGKLIEITNRNPTASKFNALPSLELKSPESELSEVLSYSVF